MTQPERFIEVVAAAQLDRPISHYEATLSIHVATRRKDTCLGEMISLRGAVMVALSAAGLAESNIQDRSGSFEQSRWSSSKESSQEFFVQCHDLKTLIDAMASVEDVFVAFRQRFWSPVKRSFRFSSPQPHFELTPESVRSSLAKAIEEAELQATALAGRAGLKLNGVMSVVQLTRAEASPTTSNLNELTAEDMLFEVHGGTEFTAASPRHDSGSNMYRVRFAVS